MHQKPIMILGCTSDAGKSFLAAALCRYFANQGIRVAPFKAQNMSNNAAVTSEGLEIGRAQYFQALAARIPPQARMNPVLLKPSSDTYSQVIVLGKFSPEISAMPWLERKKHLWPIVKKSLHSLIDDFDRVIIEGAGSPAEINLRQSDIVNMSVALEAQADVYLAADIDRGGAFAHLLGTWMCLSKDEQALIKGFVLNKFRGDQKLLGNARDWLKEKTGIPTSAVIPYVRNVLPEEDSFRYQPDPIKGSINIALIVYPYASNMDEFDALINEPGVWVVPIHDFACLDNFKAVILPGSKNTAESLRFLRTMGLAEEIKKAAGRGTKILGVCGGMQLLGKRILDPQNLESGDVDGLGLLDITTTLESAKVTKQHQLLWDGSLVKGYEIHHGITAIEPGVSIPLGAGLGWQKENICGVYLHGLLENTSYRQRFLESLGWQGQACDWQQRLESELDGMAEVIKRSGWF
jgi:adenosylcobyric acid synthase